MSDDVAICGICLRTDRNLKEIDKRLSDFHDEILVGDTTMVFPDPKYCWECEHLLRKMYNFKEKCVKAANILSIRRKIKPQLRKTPHFLYKLLPKNPLGVWFAWNTKIYDITCTEVGVDPNADTEEPINSYPDDKFVPKCVTCVNMPIGPILKVNMEDPDTVLKLDIVKPEFNQPSVTQVYTPAKNLVTKGNEINEKVDGNNHSIHIQQVLELYTPTKNSMSKTSVKTKKVTNLNKFLLKSMSKENVPIELMLNTNIPIVKEIIEQNDIVKNEALAKYPASADMAVAKSISTINNMQGEVYYNEVLDGKIKFDSPILNNITNPIPYPSDVHSSMPLLDDNFSNDNDCDEEEVEENSHMYVSSFSINSNGDDPTYITDDFINNNNDIEEDRNTPDNDYTKEGNAVKDKKTLSGLANISLDDTDVEDITVNNGVDETFNLDDIGMNEQYAKFPEVPQMSIDDDRKAIDEEPSEQSKKNGSSFEAAKRKKRKHEDQVDHEKIRASLVAVIDTYGDFEIDKGIFVDKEFVTTCIDEKLLEDIWELLKNQKGLVTKSIADAKYNTVFDITYLDTEEEIMQEFERRKHYEFYINAKYKCEICYQTFPHEMLFKLHGKRHSENGGNFPCSICKCKYENRKSLYYHQKNHKAVYKCKMCPLITYHRETMKNHFNRHNELSHTCQTCDTSYKTMSAYNCHMSAVHGGSHSCTFCGNAFPSDERLQWHMTKFHQDTESASQSSAAHEVASIRHSPKPAASESEDPGENNKRARKKFSTKKYTSCRVCNIEGNYHFLVYHFKSEHPDVDMNQLYADKKGYLCHICGKGFRAAAYLKDHINKHTGRRPYECGACPLRFHGMNAVKYHRLMHRPKGNECAACGKVFRSQPNLYSHMLTHNGDRRYKCKTCSKGFLSRAALNEHIRGVHDHVRRVKKKPTSENERKVAKEEVELYGDAKKKDSAMGRYGSPGDVTEMGRYKINKMRGVTKETKEKDNKSDLEITETGQYRTVESKTGRRGKKSKRKVENGTESFGNNASSLRQYRNNTGYNNEVTQTGHYRTAEVTDAVHYDVIEGTKSGQFEVIEEYETEHYVTEDDFYKFEQKEVIETRDEIVERKYETKGYKEVHCDSVNGGTEEATDAGCYGVFDETVIYEEVIADWDDQKVETWNYGNRVGSGDVTYGITEDE